MTDNLSDNELIAKFMGHKVEIEYDVTHYTGDRHHRDWNKGPVKNIKFNLGGPIHIHGTRRTTKPYDTSWDWLMPVVEKIRYANIEGSRRNELIDNINYALSCVDIGEVYKNAVKFIVHFNSKTKPV